jgi:molybdopterin converting factor small subunit
VRVLQLGRRVLTHAGATGLTVQGTLDALGLSAATGTDVRVNGRPATGDSPLADGDVVTLIPRIKGGRV